MNDKISDYLYNKIYFLKNWNKKKFDKMIDWYAHSGLLFAVANEKEDIIGATAVRIIDSKDIYSYGDSFNHNPKGDTYFIEFMASEEKGVKSHILDMAIKELGIYKYVAYQRAKNGNRMTFLPANRFKLIHQRG